MADATHRDDDTADSHETLSHSVLAARLLRRRETSLGVIDVKHAQRHHARLASWLARRLGLLERLSARYRIADAGHYAGNAFVLAATQRGQSDDGGLSTHTFAPGGQAGGVPFISQAAPLAEAQAQIVTHRVRRGGAHASPGSPSVSETRARRETTLAADSAPTPSQPRANTEAALPFHTRERATASEPTDAFAGQSESPVSQARHESGATHSTPQDAVAPSRATSREIPADATTREERATLELNRAARFRRGVGEVAAGEPLLLAGERSGETNSSFAASDTSLHSGDARRDARAEKDAPASLPLATELSPDVRRDKQSTLPLAAAKIAESLGGARGVRQTAVAPEIHSGTRRDAAQEMVWHAASSASPHDDDGARGSGGDNIRAARSSSASSHARLAPATPEEEAEVSMGATRAKGARRRAVDEEIDLEGLTERVSRIISRQLIVERERRGFKG